MAGSPGPKLIAALLGVALAAAAAAAPPPGHQRLLAGVWSHAPVADDDCSVCHTVHRGRVGASLRAPEPDLCYQCHENVAAKDIVHEPVGEGACSKCHRAHTSDERSLLHKRIPELCLDCHPVDRAHVARNTLCTSCHTVHSSETLKLLKGERTRACGACHEPKRRGAVVHPPARQGKCLVCHFTHPDPRFRDQKHREPQLAVAEHGVRRSPLCEKCHPAGLAQDLSYPATRFRRGDENLHARHAQSAPGVACTACHDVHSSPVTALVAERVRRSGKPSLPLEFRPESGGGRCGVACHGARSYRRSDPPEPPEVRP